MNDMQEEGWLSSFMGKYRTLKLGDTGKGVERLQDALCQLGLLMPMYRTGTYDSTTHSAICAYQRDRMLPITGKVDDETEKALRNELEGKDKSWQILKSQKF